MSDKDVIIKSMTLKQSLLVWLQDIFLPESSLQAWQQHVTHDSTTPPPGQLTELKTAGITGAFTVCFNVVDALSYKLESGFIQFHCESKQDRAQEQV